MHKNFALDIRKNLSLIPDTRSALHSLANSSKNPSFDFDTLFGDVKPFEVGVKLWYKQWNSFDWFAAYKVHGICIVFIFINSRDSKIYVRIHREFKDANKLIFQSEKLINLIGYDWTANHLEAMPSVVTIP